MTLHVPADLEQQLKEYSRRKGKTEQQTLEEILRQVLQNSEKSNAKKRAWIGMASSELSDLSERVDELLFAEGLRGES
jgi:dephospho-CoA kinase